MEHLEIVFLLQNPKRKLSKGDKSGELVGFGGNLSYATLVYEEIKSCHV